MPQELLDQVKEVIYNLYPNYPDPEIQFQREQRRKAAVEGAQILYCITQGEEIPKELKPIS